VTHRIVLALVFVLVGVVGSRSAGAEPLAQQPEVAAALQVLDAWVAAAVASREMPGLAIAIVHDQDVIWAKGYGLAGWLGPAGGLASTVDDLAKFVSLQFRDRVAGGPQILKGSTLREMRRPQWLRPDWQSGQGLGFALRGSDGALRVGHGGLLPGTDLFRMRGGWAAGELANFELDAQGRVTRLVAGNIYWTRK
jgi:CubicO group peptidase (beta-lactamase class C family)